jgi:hypothetical protein
MYLYSSIENDPCDFQRASYNQISLHTHDQVIVHILIKDKTCNYILTAKDLFDLCIFFDKWFRVQIVHIN